MSVSWRYCCHYTAFSFYNLVYWKMMVYHMKWDRLGHISVLLGLSMFVFSMMLRFHFTRESATSRLLPVCCPRWWLRTWPCLPWVPAPPSPSSWLTARPTAHPFPQCRRPSLWPPSQFLASEPPPGPCFLSQPSDEYAAPANKGNNF